MTDRLEMPIEQFVEAVSKENDRLRQEVERLTKKCDTQAMMLRRLDAEKFPGTYFIHSGLGETDHNGMPERLMVVPAYGVDFSYIYQRTDKTTGPEW
jgi:hypothetical protein